MSETTEPSPNPPLKLEELPIDAAKPWGDDALDRKKIARSLTNLISGEQGPLVLSLSGGWGTGKTFLLKRWQKQLELEEYRAIYFSAWEDDYCCDPLVAVIGQLWQSLQGSNLQEVRNSLREAAIPVIGRVVANTARLATGGIVDIDPKDLKSVGENALGGYLEERKNREELRERLTKMSSKILKDTDRPLVFIIDELDRCRPTFAIELLEQIKHIFDVSNIIFVFGLDRKQLGMSIKSVYGDIDVDGYLRRFFDMDFQLPQADAQRFCKHLMDRHQLNAYFEERSKTSKALVHDQEYGEFRKFFHRLCAHFELSLRDMEHSVRTFLIVVRNIEDRYRMYPSFLAILIILRLKDHDLYVEYTTQRCPASKVLDFLHDFLEIERGSGSWNRYWLDSMLYLTDYDQDSGRDIVAEQIESLGKEDEPTRPDLLSKRTKALAKEEIAEFRKKYLDTRNNIDDSGGVTRETVHYLSGKLELASLVTDSR